MQETIQERDERIKDLEIRLVESKPAEEVKPHADNTLTIVGILINLYKFFFPPGKVA